MIKVYSGYELEARMSHFGFQIPFFHIVGIRSKESIPNAFDDHIYLIKAGTVIGGPYSCTTNPGAYWLWHLLNPDGTAIVAADMQFINSHTFGLHKGKDALIQYGDLKGHRDKNNNGIEEEFGPLIVLPTSCRIDIHGTYKTWVSIEVGQYSAACQVLNSPDQFQEFMTICRASAKTLFTYTLLNEF